MRSFLAIFVKDFKCFFRAKSIVAAAFGFSLLMVVVASFSFRQIGFSPSELLLITPGVIWLVFIFSGVIVLNHSFLIEKENDALSGLLLSAGRPALVFIAKAASNLLFLSLLQIFVIVIHSILFGVDVSQVFFQLLLISFLVICGFVCFGTLLSAMSVATAGREFMLPLLLFPLCIPLFAGAVFTTKELLLSGTISFDYFWLRLIIGFDVISIALSYVLFEHTVQH